MPLMKLLPQNAKPAQKPSTSTRITWRLTILHRSPLFTSRPPCCSGAVPWRAPHGSSQPAAVDGDDRRLAPPNRDGVLCGPGPLGPTVGRRTEAECGAAAARQVPWRAVGEHAGG